MPARKKNHDRNCPGCQYNAAVAQCRRCNNLICEMDMTCGHFIQSPLCAWMTPKDWKALKPFFTGTFDGVHVSGQ